MRLPRPAVAVRWLIAALIGCGGVFLLARVMYDESNWVAIFGKSLFGLAAMMTGILLTAPELVGWVLVPVHRLLDSIFLPSELEPPPADFTLARFYGSQLRYAEACEEYEKIVRYHPGEKAAYLEGIQAARQSGDEAAARKFHRAAKRVMRSADQRQLLENVFAVRYELPESTETSAEEMALPNEETPANTVPVDPVQ